MKKIVILMGLLGFLAACDAPGTSSTMVAPEASSNKLQIYFMVLACVQVLSFKIPNKERLPSASALYLFIRACMDIFDRVAQSFESQAFMKTIGAELISVEQGKVIILSLIHI